MRFPIPALLIALGILFLWIAISGRLDRLLTGFQYVTGSTDALASAGVGGAGVASTFVDPSGAHLAGVMAALPTVVQLSGGLNV